MPVFINLQISDLEQTRTFWTALGYGFNPQFSDDKVLCLIIEAENSFAMLHTPGSFERFLVPGGSAADPRMATEVLLSFSLDSRESVDALFTAAEANGGSLARPTEDLGFMYTRPFLDPDGHLWEPFFFDMAKAAEMFGDQMPQA